MSHRHRSARHHVRGFTMIEILIAVIILAIGAAVAVPRFLRTTDQARSVEAIQELHGIHQAELAYQTAHGRFTDALEDLALSPDPDLQPTERHFDYAIEQATDDQLLVVASATGGPNDGQQITIDQDGKITERRRESPPQSTAAGSSGSDTSGGVPPAGSGTIDSDAFTSDTGVITRGGGGTTQIEGFVAIGNNGFVTLGWDAPTDDDIVGTAIYRAVTAGGPYELVAEVDNASLINYYADFEISNSTTYFYDARPIFSDGLIGSSLDEPLEVIAGVSAEAALKAAASLDVLAAHPATGSSPFLVDIGAFLRANNVSIGFTAGVADDSIVGFFDSALDIVLLNNSYFEESNEYLASILAHEGTHAWFELKSATAIAATLSAHPTLEESDLHIDEDPGNSIDQEYHAFMAGFRVWDQVDDGDHDSYTELSDAFLASSEASVKTLYVRPVYADQALPEY